MNFFTIKIVDPMPCDHCGEFIQRNEEATYAPYIPEEATQFGTYHQKCWGRQAEMRRKILVVLKDQVACFLFYDRKEDEDLPMGAIENAIKSGAITIQDMVDFFEAELKDNLG